MRIFAIKRFHKWAKSNDLSDDLLRAAVIEIDKGIVDANLGGNLYKKRIATKGRGKSGSVRTLLAYSAHKRTFFLYAFEKSGRDNVTNKEKVALQVLGKSYLDLSEAELIPRLRTGAIIEITKKGEQ
jgi:hypothetical protein